MKTILIFSKYFGYNVGGAEKSVFELLLEKEKEGYKIKVLIVKNVQTFNAQDLKMKFPSSWEIEYIDFKIDLLRFRYIQYLINKSILSRYVANMSTNIELWSYGFYAPAILNSFTGKTTYLVRDEYGLGWDRNYFAGMKKYLKNIYKSFEYIFYLLWKKDLYKTIKKSNLIANSNFIAKELNKICKKDIEIKYSYVNKKKLLYEYQLVNKINNGIVMIGDNRLKGSDIFFKLAKIFNQETFYIFDRKFIIPKKINNIIYMPWQKKSTNVYSYAKLVIVPSRWEEAFPRTILEAEILNIPVICSSRGGNVEAISNKNNIVFDLENLDEWSNKISRVL